MRGPGRDRQLPAWSHHSPQFRNLLRHIGDKKDRKTLITASNIAVGKPKASISPWRNSTSRRPFRPALSRARSRRRSARSAPMTCPAGPTIEAAGIADARLPQPTSRTVDPAVRARRSTVGLPYRSQNARGSSSKWSEAALWDAAAFAFAGSMGCCMSEPPLPSTVGWGHSLPRLAPPVWQAGSSSSRAAVRPVLTLDCLRRPVHDLVVGTGRADARTR
jgi:hypothetical protein